MVEDTIAELEEEGFVISYEPIGRYIKNLIKKVAY
jgi:hypothetical protein